MKSLDLAVAPEIANASRTLKEAADDFIQLCAGVIVPADEMLAQSPEPEWSGGEGLYCSREEPCWQTIARRCLLADGFPVTFPVAVIVDEVEAGKVIDFVVEVFPGPGPTLIGPHPVEFDHANHEFHAAAAEAWRAALSASMPPHVAAWSRGLKAGNGKMPLTGESAGGAFSLALRRALRAKDYPGAVVVLAAVKGAVLLPLGPPEDDRVNKSIRLKVNAILQNPRIDTIATVREHGPYIRSLLAGQDRVRVVEITPGWGSSLA